MSDLPADNLGAAPAIGGAGVGAQEPAAGPPRWAVVRAAVALPRLARGDYATVDLADPAIQRRLAAGWLVPLPAAQQPPIEEDADGYPQLKEAQP